MTEIHIADIATHTYIHIFYSESNEGFMYMIYKEDPRLNDDADDYDGGLCTGSLLDAIDMACAQAGIDVTTKAQDPSGTFLVAYAGQCVRIMANDEQSALYQAQADYNRPATAQLLDWKDSEYQDDVWDIIKIND